MYLSVYDSRTLPVPPLLVHLCGTQSGGPFLERTRQYPTQVHRLSQPNLAYYVYVRDRFCFKIIWKNQSVGGQVDTVHRVSLLTDTFTLVVFIHRTLYLDWSLSLLLV